MIADRARPGVAGPAHDPAPTPTPPGRLPYGPLAMRLLGPLRVGFHAVQPPVVLALEAGLGALVSNPVTGYLLVLRTRGRVTGRLRSTPLGYVVLDGSIYCCAGFGERTAWYRNLVAQPAVEVVLPGRTLAASATPVTDAAEWARSYRALMRALGIVGRLTVGDVRRLDDAALVARHGGLPMVRIRPHAFVPGPLDPGGRGWLLALAAWLVPLAALLRPALTDRPGSAPAGAAARSARGRRPRR